MPRRKVAVMKTARFFMLCCCALLSAALFCGCEEFSEILEEALDPETEVTDDPNSEEFIRKNVLTLHTLVKYPRASQLERKVSSIDGETVWINSNPLLSSKNIKAAKVVARPGAPNVFDLEVKLDRKGKLQWDVISGNCSMSGEPLAVLVDGMYFGTFMPDLERGADRDWVLLRVGINGVTARGVADVAHKNYVNFNPDSSHWF